MARENHTKYKKKDVNSIVNLMFLFYWIKHNKVILTVILYKLN